MEAEVILKQIAVSLAVAEEEFSFEHRDLHLGNILVKRNRSKTASYKIGGRDISFQCLGLQVTIIDFTLSLLSDQGKLFICFRQNSDMSTTSISLKILKNEQYIIYIYHKIVIISKLKKSM